MPVNGKRAEELYSRHPEYLRCCDWSWVSAALACTNSNLLIKQIPPLVETRGVREAFEKKTKNVRALHVWCLESERSAEMRNEVKFSCPGR